MFRNTEGYADPTAGAALAHISYEERRKKRRNHHENHSSNEQKPVIQKNYQTGNKKSIDHQHRPVENRTIKWIQIWPKDQAGKVYVENRMRKSV